MAVALEKQNYYQQMAKDLADDRDKWKQSSDEWRDENLPGRSYYIDVSADASKAPEAPPKEETKKSKANKAAKSKAAKPNKVSDHVATRKAAATARKEEQQILTYPHDERFVTSDGYTFGMPSSSVSKAGSKTKYSVLGLYRRKTKVEVHF